MNDYLEVYEKFKDVKDINDYIEDVRKLRNYYATGQLQGMLKHIDSLEKKYVVERVLWNMVNNEAPITYQQHYINTENFMRKQGAKLIVEKVTDFKKRLSQEEIALVEETVK